MKEGQELISICKMTRILGEGLTPLYLMRGEGLALLCSTWEGIIVVLFVHSMRKD
jgi:hypothetical protein